MASFVPTQTFKYLDHSEEMAVLARALDFLARKDFVACTDLLVARHSALLAAQTPRVTLYDPRGAGE